MNNNYKKLLVILVAVFISVSTVAQEDKDPDNYSVYELMSAYYNDNFRPFKKKNIYVGFNFSLKDTQEENTTGILQNIIKGDRLNYSTMVKAGYFFTDYTMGGINFEFSQNKFNGTVFRDPDTVLSSTITRNFDLTPNIRTSIPLTINERLSFFIELGVTLGYRTSLTQNVRNTDAIDRTFTEGMHFRAGLSPGITFFAIESFAFEVQLNVIGYDILVKEETINNIKQSKVVEQKVDANINLLSLQLGLSYYLRTKK